MNPKWIVLLWKLVASALYGGCLRCSCCVGLAQGEEGSFFGYGIGRMVSVMFQSPRLATHDPSAATA